VAGVNPVAVGLPKIRRPDDGCGVSVHRSRRVGRGILNLGKTVLSACGDGTTDATVAGSGQTKAPRT
jgi:hypothetical protein